MRMYFQKHRHLMLPSSVRLASAQCPARQQSALHDGSSLSDSALLDVRAGKMRGTLTGHTVGLNQKVCELPHAQE